MNLQTVSAFVLTVLANGIWQAVLLALVAWLVLRFAKTASATTRHAVLAAALLGAIVLPVATTAVDFAAPRDGAQTTALPSLHASALPATGPRTTQHAAPPLRKGSAGMPASAVIARPRFSVPQIAIYAVLAVWLTGALLLVVRLIVSLLHLERLKRDALPVPIAVRERLERWDAAGKGDRDVRLCRSADVSVPIGVGIFDAMILVPDHLIADLPSDDLDRILLHELAHLRRADDWLNALERFAEAVLFFNPAVRWIVRQLDLEREVACDDWVLERRSEAVPYAQCLVKLVESVAWPHRAVTAPGIFVSRRSISIRIERLLAKHRDVRLHISMAPLAAVAAVAIAVCVAGLYVSPSFAASSPPAAEAGVSVWTALAPPSAPSQLPDVAAPHATIASHETVLLQRPATRQVVLSTSPEPKPLPDATRVAMRTLRLAPVAAHAPQAEPAPAPAPAASGDYISGMASVGYPNLSVDELVGLRAIGVTPDYVRDLQGVGLPHPSLEDLRRLRAAGVTPDYVRDMRAVFGSMSVEELQRCAALGVDAGYVREMRSLLGSLSLEDVTQLRAVGVTPEYVHQMRGAFGALSVDDVRRMRALGVTPDYVRDMRGVFGTLSLEDITRFRALGVTSDYIRSMRAIFPGLSTEHLTQMRAVGVTPDYIADLKAAGVTGISADNVTGVRAVGVDATFVRALAQAGYPNLSIDDYRRARAVGVDQDFLQSVRRHNLHNLTLDDLVRLKVSGVLDQ